MSQKDVVAASRNTGADDEVGGPEQSADSNPREMVMRNSRHSSR